MVRNVAQDPNCPDLTSRTPLSRRIALGKAFSTHDSLSSSVTWEGRAVLHPGVVVRMS